MRQFILDFPAQFEKGVSAAKAANISFSGKKFSNLVICGMGGSALPAEILKILPHLNLPVVIHRSYGLPLEANENSLIFISSYSGNTEEEISALNEAMQKKFNIVVFSEEGEIQKIAKEKNIFFVDYPKDAEGFQPRFGLGCVFSAMLSILGDINLVPCEVKEKLSALSKFLTQKNLRLEEEGKLIAEKIFGKIMIIYAPHEFRGLSYIWKINFNETSKIPAFSNCFPELNHNEMNGFLNLAKIADGKIMILNLFDEQGNERLLKRSKITADLLLKQNIETINIPLNGENPLQKIFSSVLLSMWTSYYLAKLYNTEPEEVKIVEDFKELLRK